MTQLIQKDLLVTTRITKTVSSFMYEKDFNTDNTARMVEIRFAGFLAIHNLHLAAADHFIDLTGTSFPDSKKPQTFKVTNEQCKPRSLILFQMRVRILLQSISKD